MRQILIFFLLVVQMATKGEGKDGSHLEALKAAYPYGLLTDDYGILNMDDLKINTCIATPSPFTEKFHSYPYWQCFEVKNAKMVCEGNKYDPDQKTRVALQVLSGVRNGELHEFLARRLWSVESCQNRKKNWHKLIKGEQYVCISGDLISKHVENGKTRWVWTYGRFKTTKGCDSYFADECDLKLRVAKGNCPGS
jgi:hypothetical protein